MRVSIVERPIDAAALVTEVANAGSGATLLFVGTVRDVNDGRPVTGIEYSAYTAMAQKELEAIARETVERFVTDHVVIEHRLGTLALGDASVAIAVSHPRRAPAFEASRYVIEQLKRRVPIWKREHYADGTREWVDPTADRGLRTTDAAIPTQAIATGGSAAAMHEVMSDPQPAVRSLK